MPRTTWELELKSKGNGRVKALARDVRDLASALKELGDHAHVLRDVAGSASALRGAKVRIRAEGQVSAARTKARTTEARDADRVRRTVEGIQGRSDRAALASGQRSARLNALAFRRDGMEGARAAQRTAAANTRAAATARRDWHTAQRAQSEGWSDAFKSMGLVLGIAGAISAATVGALSVIADMIGAVGQLVFRISSAVLEMIAFREASLTTLRALARDDAGNHLRGGAADAQARQRFRFAQSFARETPLDAAQVIGLQRQTSAAGFNGRRNEEVVRAAADVGAFNPSDADASRRFLLGLGQLHNASTVRTQDVRQTAEAAGLGENDILRQIARGAGVTQRRGEADAAYNGRIQAMQRGGRFTGRQGEEGVLAALRERNGGELGSFARQQGGTLTGTLSNLRGAVLDFVTSIDDIENLPGIKALKKLLNGIVDALTGTGPVAKRLRQDFAAIVDQVSGFAASLGAGGGKDGVQGLLGSGLDLLDRWGPLVMEIMRAFGGSGWEAFRAGLAPLLAELGGGTTSGTEQWIVFARQLGSSLGTFLAFGVRVTAMFGVIAVLAASGVGYLVRFVEWMGSLPSMIFSVLLPMTTLFPNIGGSIVDGLAQGFRARAGGFLTEVSTWGTDIADSVKGALGIASPSRVFRDEVGVMIPRGVSEGIDRGARDVERSLAGMVAPQGLPGFGGAGGGLAGLGGGGISAVFNITVQGGGSNEETGREIGEASWTAFVDRLERGAAMQGA